MFCSSCGGHHEPDSEDSYVIYGGYRFTKPFHCMCCGKEICARQFAFGRCCGPCDIGACDTENFAFRQSAAHRRPSWFVLGNGKETIKKFAEEVGAIPLI